MKKLLIITIIAFNAISIFAQTQKFDIMTYVQPKGYTKESKPDYLMFSKIDEKKGQYCLISLYRALPSQGSGKENFAAAWKAMVADQLSPKGEPELTEAEEDDVEVMMGNAQVEYNGIAGLGYLTTLTVQNKMIIVLAVFNAETYLQDVQGFIESLDMDSSESPKNQNQNVSSAKPSGNLAGIWTDSDSFAANYVNPSGNYVGDASIGSGRTLVLRSDGTYTDDFTFVNNTKFLQTNDVGRYEIKGDFLTLKNQSSRTRVWDAKTRKLRTDEKSVLEPKKYRVLIEQRERLEMSLFAPENLDGYPNNPTIRLFLKK